MAGQAKQLCGRQPRRLAAIDDGLDDVGSEPGEPEGGVDVGGADALGLGDVMCKRGEGPASAGRGSRERGRVRGEGLDRGRADSRYSERPCASRARPAGVVRRSSE